MVAALIARICTFLLFDGNIFINASHTKGERNIRKNFDIKYIIIQLEGPRPYNYLSLRFKIITRVLDDSSPRYYIHAPPELPFKRLAARA